MLSLLFLSVLLSGALPSHALTSLTFTEFTTKLRDLHQKVPVYIIQTKLSSKGLYKVRSTLNELENHLNTKVYLYEIFGSLNPLVKTSTCTNRNFTGSAAGNNSFQKLRVNQINARSLSEMKRIMTIWPEKTQPIFVVSIYSEHNATYIRNIKCWVRDKTQKRFFVVTRVHGVVKQRRKRSANSFATETIEPIENFSNSKKFPESSETYTRDSEVQSSSAENRPEVDPAESDFTERGTELWVSSSFATKSLSEAVIRRRKPHVYENNEEILKSYPKIFPFDYGLHYNRENVGDDSPGNVTPFPTSPLEEDSSDVSNEWNSPSTTKSTLKPSILKPTNNQSFGIVFQRNNGNNVHEINYEQDKGSNLLDPIYNTFNRIKNGMETIAANVNVGGRKSFAAVKNGFNKLKQVSLDAYNKVINFF